MVRRPHPELPLLLVSVLATAAVVVPGVLLAGGPAPPLRLAAASVAPADPVGPPSAATEVLSAWDGRRAAAWAAGDLPALEELYVAGSAAGRHDRSMLARWVDRGLRVADLRVELLAVEVLDERPSLLRLRVTDRVAAGRAVGRGLDTALPEDGPTTREVVLRRVAGEWLVATVG